VPVKLAAACNYGLNAMRTPLDRGEEVFHNSNEHHPTFPLLSHENFHQRHLNAVAVVARTTIFGQFFTPELIVVVSHIRWQQTGLIGLRQSLYGFLIENQ